MEQRNNGSKKGKGKPKEVTRAQEKSKGRYVRDSLIPSSLGDPTKFRGITGSVSAEDKKGETPTEQGTSRLTDSVKRTVSAEELAERRTRDNAAEALEKAVEDGTDISVEVPSLIKALKTVPPKAGSRLRDNVGGKLRRFEPGDEEIELKGNKDLALAFSPLSSKADEPEGQTQEDARSGSDPERLPEAADAQNPMSFGWRRIRPFMGYLSRWDEPIGEPISPDEPESQEQDARPGVSLAPYYDTSIPKKGDVGKVDPDRLREAVDALNPFNFKWPSESPKNILGKYVLKGKIKAMLDGNKKLGDSDKDAIIEKAIARENEIGKDGITRGDIVQEEVQKHLAEKGKLTDQK